MASAGISISPARSNSCPSLAAPSSIEYSVCTCRCTNESDEAEGLTDIERPPLQTPPGHRAAAVDICSSTGSRQSPAGTLGPGNLLSVTTPEPLQSRPVPDVADLRLLAEIINQGAVGLPQAAWNAGMSQSEAAARLVTMAERGMPLRLVAEGDRQLLWQVAQAGAPPPRGSPAFPPPPPSPPPRGGAGPAAPPPAHPPFGPESSEPEPAAKSDPT